MEGGPSRLSLSPTRYKLLDQCERRYLLPVRGQHRLPEPMMGVAKDQGKLMAWHMFVGQVVDETIVMALFQYRAEGRWPSSLHDWPMRS